MLTFHFYYAKITLTVSLSLRRKIMIVAAVGKNASGKDYFLDVIAKQFNIPVISFGDCARELADKEGLVHTRENLQYISKNI